MKFCDENSDVLFFCSIGKTHLSFTEPLHMVTPIVQDVTARSVNVTWKPPMTPNGIVTEYNIYWNNTLSQVVRHLLFLFNFNASF